MKLANIILSWDTFISLIVTGVSYSLLPDELKLGFVCDFFNIGITVLSIVFSIFFAALAVIMTSSDNDFIKFLEEENHFTQLLNSFKITLLMLFVSLIVAISFNLWTQFQITISGEDTQSKWYFLIFEFLFLYSLIATALSVHDTILFSKYRAEYMNQK
jgi:ABC-type spermidine/putrescine transport system permease subunit I